MNKMKWMVLFMSITMIFSGCASMNNTGKGAAIGGGSGAALGAILGGVIGKGKGAAIGAAIGTAVGAGTGALIGKKMDKAAAEAKQIEGAQVEQITDNNGLQAVKVTFILAHPLNIMVILIKRTINFILFIMLMF